MSLMHLPLIVVQDIIEQVVLSYDAGWWGIKDPLQEILTYRLVNKVFEREVTRYFGRHRLPYCYHDKVGDQQRDFVIRLLRAHIGERNRPHSEFIAQLHAGVDCLATQFCISSDQKTEDDIVHDLAEVVLRSGILLPLTQFCLVSDIPYQERLQAAFMITVIMQYTNIQTSMLEAKLIDFNQDWKERLPLPLAIRLGLCETVERLINAGASWEPTRRITRAINDAARVGHIDVIALVLSRCPPTNVPKHCAYTTQFAAESKHWNVIDFLIDNFTKDLSELSLRSTLCWASRYGANDMIIKIMDRYPDIRPRNIRVSKRGKFPLREAVRGGHKSTVQLLLDNGALGDDVEAHTQILANNVAKSGQICVVKLLREYYFWKAHSEHVFLPIAAEYGHLDFAKFAIMSFQKPRKMMLERDGRPRYLDHSLYISLLHATISNHREMVQWLVDDVGVDVNDEENLGQRGEEGHESHLTPLIVAIDTGNMEMVQMLIRDLGAKPLDGVEITPMFYRGRDQAPCRRYEHLSRYRADLKLEPDFHYPRASQQAIYRAAEAAGALLYLPGS